MIGQDYIGVGVGAMVFNEQNQVFLAQRGPQARNEKGCWEFPGGRVEFGEKLVDALHREFLEEYGLQIEIIELLCVTDHILRTENQHWVSPTFLARHVTGVAQILEPEKCTAIGWFSLDELPAPLSLITIDNLNQYRARFVTSSIL
ncbi:MAG: NUDIX domain-containing protein [Chloroflexi bacterium]|nr:NUDIX domain-containing protein [Chloroflexota bacterium]